MKEDVLGVYTGKDLSIMQKEGGSGYWVIRQKRLNDIKYILFMRSERQSGSVKKDGIENGQAFLVAKFSGAESQDWNQGRFLLKISQYSLLENKDNLKNAWKKLTGNQRFPIAYFSLEEINRELSLDIMKISQEAWINFESSSLNIHLDLDLKEAILEAKRAIAKIAKVNESNVNITINY